MMNEAIYNSTFTHWGTLLDLYNKLSDGEIDGPARSELKNLVMYVIRDRQFKNWRAGKWPVAEDEEFWHRWKLDHPPHPREVIILPAYTDPPDIDIPDLPPGILDEQEATP